MELLEIYDRLGLIYPNLYNAIARQKMGLSYPRQSGRTTNMLCRALHASQQGAVLVLVYGKQEADLKKRVRAWAEYLGLDHKNIIVERPQNEYSYSGMKLYAYFADHLLREHGKVEDGVLHQLQRATQRWSQEDAPANNEVEGEEHK